MNLGENLRWIREARQISRQALADDLNLSYSSICKYECGNRTPDYDTLARMANVFQVSMESLLAPHSEKDSSKYPILDLPGDTVCEQPDTYVEEKPAEISGLSDEELYLITLYRGLDSTRRSAVRDLLEPLAAPEIWRAQSSRKKKRK